MLLNLGFVQPVDNRILSLGHENLLDLHGYQYPLHKEVFMINNLSLILEADLPHSHAAVFLQVGPWRVDNCDVVLLVA